jgi:hypothetical protein
MRSIKIAAISVVALLALATGCSKKPSDDTLANDIKAKLFSDPDLRSTNINVAVQNGAVTLSGDVPNSNLELKAVKIANDTPGVSRVDDQIKLPGGSSARRGVRGETAGGAGQSGPPDNGGGVASPNNPPGMGGPGESAQSAPPQPVTVTIPSGTPITIRMIDSVDSATNTAGQEFRASLDDSIRLNGQVVVPRHTDVTVRLAEAQSAGRVRGQSNLELQLVSMNVNGERVPLQSNVYDVKGKARGKQTLERSGIGAAAGAIIGALAGGGKGAAVGAAVGGGGVAGYQVFTHGQQVKIPAETLLNFTLQAPVNVEVAPQ